MPGRTANELKSYLRKRRGGRQDAAIPEFDEFLKDVSILFELRMVAEEYWQGSPRASSYKFEEHRYLAKSILYALPLEWGEVYDVVCPGEEVPRKTLIVHLAAHCVEEVRLISMGLRKELSRERESTPIGKVQQLDTRCMQWLMRQPGVGLAEKAGMRQRILSVVRREQYNMLENRVFKDFLIRCINLADGYLKEIEKYKGQKVYKSVREMKMVCQKALSLPEMDLITGLATLPQPNYVLQQDNRYSKIWNGYCKVVRLANLAEKLWGRREAIRDWIEQITEEAKWQNGNKGIVKYRTQVWLNPLKGFDVFHEGAQFEHAVLFGEEIGKRAEIARCVRHVEDGVGVVDLSCRRAWGSELIRGGRHENARPRIRRDLFQFYDDVMDLEKGSATSVGLKDIFSKLNGLKDRTQKEYQTCLQDARDYAERLVGEYRNQDRTLREIVILAPDDWDVYAQEEVIRIFSFPMHSRASVHLLWRSVAMVLGLEEELLPHLKENDYVAVVDFRNDGTILVKGLKYLYDEESGRLVPQRNKARVALVKWGTDIFQNDLIKSATVICLSGDITIKARNDLRWTYHCHLMLNGKGVLTGEMRLNGQVKYVYVDSELGWSQGDGARLFCRERNLRTLYFDELEPMWVVGQRADEKIVSSKMVEPNERFKGGTTEEYPIDCGLLSIGAGQNAVKFFFHIGGLTDTTKLHEYREELAVEPSRVNVALKGRVLVSPGQGIAITKIEPVEAGYFKEVLTLDYLKNMWLGEESIESLEMKIPRSYPPTCAVVEAYGETDYEWAVKFHFDEQLRETRDTVLDYLADTKKLSKIPNDAFAKARRKTKAELVPGESLLHLLDRRNVFGNRLGVTRPYWLADKQQRQIVNKLTFALKQALDQDQDKVYRKCLRLLAWMYLGENPKIQEVARWLVKKYETKKVTDAGLLPEEGTFLANTLSTSGLEGLECRVLNVLFLRLSNPNANCGTDLRILYNLLQFDSKFFEKWITPFRFTIREAIGVVKLILYRLVKYKDNPANYKSCVRVFLYFLRIRESERDFLRPKDWNGSWAHKELADVMDKEFNKADKLLRISKAMPLVLPGMGVAEPLPPLTDVDMLKDVAWKFLNGSGTLEDIVNIMEDE